MSPREINTKSPLLFLQTRRLFKKTTSISICWYFQNVWFISIHTRTPKLFLLIIRIRRQGPACWLHFHAPFSLASIKVQLMLQSCENIQGTFIGEYTSQSSQMMLPSLSRLENVFLSQRDADFQSFSIYLKYWQVPLHCAAN